MKSHTRGTIVNNTIKTSPVFNYFSFPDSLCFPYAILSILCIKKVQVYENTFTRTKPTTSCNVSICYEYIWSSICAYWNTNITFKPWIFFSCYCNFWPKSARILLWITYSFKQEYNLVLLFLFHYVPSKVSIKHTNGIVASRLDSLAHKRPTRIFGGGGWTRASFQRVTYKKKRIYIYVLYVGLIVLTFNAWNQYLFFVFGLNVPLQVRAWRSVIQSFLWPYKWYLPWPIITSNNWS